MSQFRLKSAKTLLTSSPGSLAECPDHLLKPLKKLEADFSVPTAKLKEIADHFRNELIQGLTPEGGDIVSSK
jgi:hexokinase